MREEDDPRGRSKSPAKQKSASPARSPPRRTERGDSPYPRKVKLKAQADVQKFHEGDRVADLLRPPPAPPPAPPAPPAAKEAAAPAPPGQKGKGKGKQRKGKGRRGGRGDGNRRYSH